MTSDCPQSAPGARPAPRLGFRPKAACRIVVIMGLSIEYDRGVFRGICRYLRTHKRMKLLKWRDADRMTVAQLRELRPDGVILHSASSDRELEISSLGIPTVNISNRLMRTNLPQVVSNDVAVGEMVAAHFISRGFKQFAFCGYRHYKFSEQRAEGYVGALARERHGCLLFGAGPLHEDPSAGTNDEEFQARLTQWVAGLAAPVGVMACNDTCAEAVVKACLAAKRNIPDEVAVIGVDNDEMLCETSDVPLSSVVQNAEGVGYKAVACLQQMIRDPRKRPRTVLLPPRGIVVRRSSDVLAVEDAVVAQALRQIREHMDGNIRIADLAKAMSVSRRSFELRFRRALGRSPYEQVLVERIERARQLLVETDKPVGQIAESVGFSELRQLCVMFRGRIGMTPTAYRNQFRMR